MWQVHERARVAALVTASRDYANSRPVKLAGVCCVAIGPKRVNQNAIGRPEAAANMTVGPRCVCFEPDTATTWLTCVIHGHRFN